MLRKTASRGKVPRTAGGPFNVRPLVHSSKRPVVVHLGNVGWGSGPEVLAEKTRRYAKRFPGVQFIGIDKSSRYLGEMPDNWRQLVSSFGEGLKKLDNNSVSVISSELALGEFGPRGRYWDEHRQYRYRLTKRSFEAMVKYTANALKVAYRKLKRGGKLYVAVVDGEPLRVTKEALARSQFNPEKIKMRYLLEQEYKRTPGTRKGCAAKLQIVAEK